MALSILKNALQNSSALTKLRESAFMDFIDEQRENPQRLRRLGMIGAGVAVAFASGQVMQRMTAPMMAAPVASAEIAAPVMLSQAEPVPALPAAERAVTETQAAMPLPPEPEVAPMQIADVANITPVSAEIGPIATRNCDPARLTLSEQEHGLFAISLEAPCAPDAEITLSQGALSYKVRTDQSGRYLGLSPAMTASPEVAAAFSDGTHVSAGLTLTHKPDGRRVGLSWDASKDLRLNAYEYGADYGGAGHVHATAARIPGTALGGYLMRLGDESLPAPRLVDVYVAPEGMTDVAFDVEAIVSETTCGRDLRAMVTQTDGISTPQTEILELAMPDCADMTGAVVMALPETALSVAELQ